MRRHVAFHPRVERHGTTLTVPRPALIARGGAELINCTSSASGHTCISPTPQRSPSPLPFVDSPLVTRPTRERLRARVSCSVDLHQARTRLMDACAALHGEDLQLKDLPRLGLLPEEFASTSREARDTAAVLVLKCHACRANLSRWMIETLLPIGVMRGPRDLRLPGPWSVAIIARLHDPDHRGFWMECVTDLSIETSDAAFLGLLLSAKALTGLAGELWSEKGTALLHLADFQRSLLDGTASESTWHTEPGEEDTLARGWLAAPYLRGLRRQAARRSGRANESPPRWIGWNAPDPVPDGLAVMALEWLAAWRTQRYPTGLPPGEEDASLREVRSRIAELIGRNRRRDLALWLGRLLEPMYPTQVCPLKNP